MRCCTLAHMIRQLLLLLLYVPLLYAHHPAMVPLTRPPMGWSTWYAFALQINETRVLEMAHVLKEEGFLAAGYSLIWLDDAWSAPARDRYGRLYGDPDRFPHGIPWLVKELDTMGFSLGLYGNAAARTCAGYPGQLGHEYVDAQTIADWGVRAWKYDNCGHIDGKVALNIRGASSEGLDARPLPFVPGGGAWGEQGEVFPWPLLPPGNGSFAPRVGAQLYQLQLFEAYRLFGDALAEASAGRQRITYAICPRIAGCDPSIMGFYANVSDTSMNQCPQHDARDAWEGKGPLLENNANSSTTWHLDNAFEYGVLEYSRPGFWHDLDYLQQGWKTIAGDCFWGSDGYCAGELQSAQEYRSQFAMWALMSVPLIVSFDATAGSGRSVTEGMRRTLLNADLIAINGDALVAPLRRMATIAGHVELFSRPLVGGRLAMGLLNRDSAAAMNLTVRFDAVGWTSSQTAWVRDCWAGEDLGEMHGEIVVKHIDSHDTLVFILAPPQPHAPSSRAVGAVAAWTV